MSKFTTTQEFTYLESDEYEALTMLTTTGSLLVSRWNGEEYVLADTFTETGSVIYFTKGSRLKFEPTGDMSFSIKAGY